MIKAIQTAFGFGAETVFRTKPPKRVPRVKTLYETYPASSMYHVCCKKATRRDCVCALSTSCPTHGLRCQGTHD